MEMNVLHRVPVDMSFCRGDEVVDGQRIPDHVFLKIKTADEFPDLGDRSMAMVLMNMEPVILVSGAGRMNMFMPVLMVVRTIVVVTVSMVLSVWVRLFFPFHLAVDGDRDVTAGNAALLILPDREDGFSVKRTVQRIQYRFGLRMQFQQGGGQHIAGGAHAAIQIDRFHRFNTSFILPVR